jgi:hypothetical protein
MSDQQPVAADPLLYPARLWTREEVLARPSPVPATPGMVRPHPACSCLAGGAGGRRSVRLRLVVVVAIAMILGGLGVGAGARGAPPGRYIVLLKDSVASPASVAHAHRAQVGFVYTAAIKGYSATLSSAAAGALRSDPRVAAVVPDREVHLAAQTLPTGALLH